MVQKGKVSAKKIADMTGVSPSTVSMVINNKGEQFRIAAKTRERVLAAAQELGYQHVARTRRKKKDFSSKMICAFCPLDFDRGPTWQAYAGFHRYLKDQGVFYDIILFPYEVGKLFEKIEFMSSDFTIGAVMLALGPEDSEFLERSQFDIPIVLYNRIAKGYCSVLTDDYDAGFKAMNHFIRRGHHKFALVSPNYSSRALSLRQVGYSDKFKGCAFKPEEAQLIAPAFADDSDAGGYAAMEEVLRAPVRPTALFAPSDNMISGIVRCIHDHGLHVPADIEIISYGNKNINYIVEPGISSFAPPTHEMSYNCMKILHNAIVSGSKPDNARLSFEASCVFRESSPAAWLT
jgi:DNA-binding LacI/PurR family transcriptional regulator